MWSDLIVRDNSVDKESSKIMLLDMNSYFASVEQQANPRLRGRPVGVVASMHRGSCLIAASKEAKKLGIKTGTVIWQAQKICPSIALVESDPDKYRQVNKGFNSILSEYSEVMERYSIDETFVDLGDWVGDQQALGLEIKRRIKQELGECLSCSIGFGANKFLAKLASDLDNNDGLMVLRRLDLPVVYKNLRMSDLWGVGRGWERRLARLGLVNPAQVLGYPVANLIAAFGKPGYYIWERINGLERDKIEVSEDAAKSYGHSWVLGFRTTDKNRLAAVIVRLAEKAARRMRADGMQAYGVYLNAFTELREPYHKSLTLPHPLLTGVDLFHAVRGVWDTWRFASNVTYLACGFFRVRQRHTQMSLFGPKVGEDNGLVQTLDDINDKYGEFTIRSGMIVHRESDSPDAIAFGL
jgi:DNA polymerase-4